MSSVQHPTLLVFAILAGVCLLVSMFIYASRQGDESDE